MEKIPRLPDEHLARARQLAVEHRKRKNCKHCYDRGWLGTDQNNMLVPCGRCVDGEAVMNSWRTYVRETPELAELYGDYFEEGEDEQA